MKFLLPQLPFKPSAIEPYISRSTIEVHYNGHLKKYIDNINSNDFIKSIKEDVELERIIMLSSEKDLINNFIPPLPQTSELFNNSAQAWNHVFYWNSISGKTDEFGGEIASLIFSRFGSLDKFKKEFMNKGMELFGNGWLWLTLYNGRIELINSQNAEIPWLYGARPLLTIDLWEHAYYLDYKNNKEKYLKAVIDNTLNWRFANKNLRFSEL